MRFQFRLFLVAGALLAASPAAQAGAGRGGSDNAAGSFNSSARIELDVNYPGDKAFPFGTARVSGPDRGPYVQRCFWTADANPLLGYFFPTNIRQTCVRYTEENTR